MKHILRLLSKLTGCSKEHTPVPSPSEIICYPSKEYLTVHFNNSKQEKEIYTTHQNVKEEFRKFIRNFREGNEVLTIEHDYGSLSFKRDSIKFVEHVIHDAWSSSSKPCRDIPRR